MFTQTYILKTVVGGVVWRRRHGRKKSIKTFITLFCSRFPDNKKGALNCLFVLFVLVIICKYVKSR